MSAAASTIDVGADYVVGPAASVQFRDPIAVRVIGVQPSAPYSEFAWLDVYQLDEYGEAVDRRSIYVRPEQLIEAAPRLTRRRRVTSDRRRTR